MSNGIPEHIIQLNLHDLIIVEMHQVLSGVLYTRYMPLLKLSYVKKGSIKSCMPYYSFIAVAGDVPSDDSLGVIRMKLNRLVSQYLSRNVVVTVNTSEGNYTGKPIHPGQIFDSSEVDCFFYEAARGVTNFYELWEKGAQFTATYTDTRDESEISLLLHSTINFFDADDKITASTDKVFRDINMHGDSTRFITKKSLYKTPRMKVESYCVIRCEREDGTPVYVAAVEKKEKGKKRGKEKKILYCSCKEDAYQFASEEDALKIALWIDSFPTDTFEIETINIPAVIERRAILDEI